MVRIGELHLVRVPCETLLARIRSFWELNCSTVKSFSSEKRIFLCPPSANHLFKARLRTSLAFLALSVRVCPFWNLQGRSLRSFLTTLRTVLSETLSWAAIFLMDLTGFLLIRDLMIFLSLGVDTPRGRPDFGLFSTHPVSLYRFIVLLMKDRLTIRSCSNLKISHCAFPVRCNSRPFHKTRCNKN